MDYFIAFLIFLLLIFVMSPRCIEYKIIVAGKEVSKKIEPFTTEIVAKAVKPDEKPVSDTISYINAETYYNRYHPQSLRMDESKLRHVPANYSNIELRSYAPAYTEQKVMMNDVLIQSSVEDVKPQNYVFNKTK